MADSRYTRILAAARFTAAAVVCCLAALSPAIAYASGSGSHGNGHAHEAKSPTTIQVTALNELDFALCPIDSLEQSVDPAVRVTVTGSEWYLYAVWDAPSNRATAWFRRTGTTGSWTRLSGSQVLIASSATAGGKHDDGDGGKHDDGDGEKHDGGDSEKHDDKRHPTTTVIDLDLRLQLGQGGADPWSVQAGAYSGRIRYFLSTDGGYEPDTADREPLADTGTPLSGLESIGSVRAYLRRSRLLAQPRTARSPKAETAHTIAIRCMRPPHRAVPRSRRPPLLRTVSERVMRVTGRTSMTPATRRCARLRQRTFRRRAWSLS
jgi:hypothetical protein